MSRRIGIRTMASVLGKVAIPPPPPPPTNFSGPYIVGASDEEGTPRAYQRKTFFAGRYWVFYVARPEPPGYMVYRSSLDGETWTDATVVKSGVADGREFSVIYANGYVHYVHYNHAAAGNPLIYRRGVINGTTIMWEPERVAVPGVSGVSYLQPTICIDSAGYPWLAYTWDKFGGPYYPYTVKATAVDGTSWETPTQMSTTSDLSWRVSIVALLSEKVYCVYASRYITAKGKLYDGWWGSEEEVTAAPLHLYGDVHCVCSEGDVVHLVYQRTTDRGIYYRQRTLAGWQSEELVRAETASVAPVISIAINDVYIFWRDTATGVIFLRRRVGGVWQPIQQPFGTTFDPPYVQWYQVTCFPKYMHGKIGVAWTAQDELGDWYVYYGVCY